MIAWLALAGAICLEVTGSLALSAATDEPVWYVLVLIGYVGAFSLLPIPLRRGMSIGVVYGIWGGSGVALTAVLSAAIFGDPLTPTMIAGLALIIAGVVAIEFGRQRAVRAAASATAEARVAP